MQLLNTLASVTYHYSSSSSSVDGSDIAILFGILAIVMLPVLIIAIVSIIGMWKVFTKMGIPGWKSIIPIYSIWVLYEGVGMMGWLSLIMLVPGLNIIVLLLNILSRVRLANGFGKSGGYAVGLILLEPIFICMLGFGSAKWNPDLIDYKSIDFVNDKQNPHVNGNAPKTTIHDDTAAKPADAPKAEDPWVEGKEGKKAE